MANLKRRLNRRTACMFQSLKAVLNLPDPAPALLRTGQPTGAEPHHMSPVFRFRDTPFYAKKSIVKISCPQGVTLIEAHPSFLHRDNFAWQFIRLNAVLQNYCSGVSKILEHSESCGYSPCFYLDLSDATHPYSHKITPADRLYAFNRRKHENAVGLVPDPYTLGDMSASVPFSRYENEQKAMSDYKGRADLVFWRGATTGKDRRHDIFSNRRIRFCVEALSFPGSVDAKITNVVQFRNNQRVLKKLQVANVMAALVRENDFAAYKATIDLDGNSAAWGTFRKYLKLVHVIKPESSYEMFYSAGQPEDAITGVRDTKEFFRMLENDAGLADNFAVAWNGYRYAVEVREKIKAGHATIFPS